MSSRQWYNDPYTLNYAIHTIDVSKCQQRWFYLVIRSDVFTIMPRHAVVSRFELFWYWLTHLCKRISDCPTWLPAGWSKLIYNYWSESTPNFNLVKINKKKDVIFWIRIYESIFPNLGCPADLYFLCWYISLRRFVDILKHVTWQYYTIKR